MISFINEARKKRLRRKIYNEVRKLNPPKILDNGCGKRGSFDYQEFKKRIIKCDIIYGINSENLPYKDESFDLVLFVGVIQYVDNPEKAMRECYRVLKDNGILIITTINKDSLIKKFTGFKEEKRSHMMQDFINFIKKFKFKVLDSSYIDFPFTPKKYRMILYCRCKKK
jgi:ubiquinone/menaquinone biosynthesis C-methylase UbiE